MSANETVIVPTDLVKISRRPKSCRTEVTLFLDSFGDRTQKWLIFGEGHLERKGERWPGRWLLKAYLPYGVCDVEHDSAGLLRLPLVGVEAQGVMYHASTFEGWIDPNLDDKFDEGLFRIPPSGYNPMKLPGATTCPGVYNEKKGLYCKWNEGKKHIIVPQGYYLPPIDTALYEAVRGKRVSIRFSPASER